MDFDSKRAWARMPQVNGVNKNRSKLAQPRGWQFAEEAPELLERWPVLPFTQRGDMRLAYGVLAEPATVCGSRCWTSCAGRW
ncbi:hypothetical protein [Actinokineospora xionganensis]|uniref:Uncharacterized protein n=1 Tax=Actinokineospora xionganensis TaxID=2684470 RepID=A0ABR7L0F1_9PSEU|nr:hypothetical protein [Actinokineospora xionganensis]MBC6446170.1 hypothetical protein [Actinokineospora xionganensis]